MLQWLIYRDVSHLKTNSTSKQAIFSFIYYFILLKITSYLPSYIFLSSYPSLVYLSISKVCLFIFLVYLFNNLFIYFKYITSVNGSFYEKFMQNHMHYAYIFTYTYMYIFRRMAEPQPPPPASPTDTRFTLTASSMRSQVN